jgi:S-adenosylmethionine-diacylglycerol 3-amino-3-carboxypropyl transferase
VLSGRALLGRAVHRSKPVSRNGILERLFTLAFSGLVYPQIWEDPLVDLAAMEIEPHHHIVAISSGGCNVLSYLTAAPQRITAVDLNPAHVALTRLKIAGANHLPDWQSYYRFFGEADAKQNLRDYRNYLVPHLDAVTRTYWEGRSWTGKQRISHFTSNIYRKGLLGRCIGLGHLMAIAYGKNMRGLLETRSPAEQRDFFDREVAPLFEKKLVKWATRNPMSLYGLGIPPAQYLALSGGAAMVDVLRQRLERLACGYPLSENYFAWQAFGRAYAPRASGSLPPYLAPDNFAAIKARANRVSVNQASLTDTIARMPAASADRFVLLDAQDWMTDEQLNALWQAITHAAAPAARVIFRTAGTSTILSGRVDASLLAKWNYLESRSLELGAKDRSSIYGGFHIYELV